MSMSNLMVLKKLMLLKLMVENAYFGKVAVCDDSCRGYVVVVVDGDGDDVN